MKSVNINMEDLMKDVVVTVGLKSGWRYKLGFSLLKICGGLIGWCINQEDKNYFKDVKILNLKKNDVIFLTTSKEMSGSEYATIKGQFKAIFPDNEGVILQPGYKVHQMKTGVDLAKGEDKTICQVLEMTKSGRQAISRDFLSVCKSCHVPHFENCPSCFGFGLYQKEDGTNYPVSAFDSQQLEFKHKVIPCNYCGSTEKGM
jgi:hypothetical protein